MKKKQSGFTLIELVVVIIIVAILAAASVPIYRNYVLRAMGSEAYAVAGSLHASLKALYAERDRLPLPTDFTPNNAAVNGFVAQTQQPWLGLDLRNNKYFNQLTYTRSNDTTYTATVIGTAGSDAAGMTLVVGGNMITATPQTYNPSWD